MKINQLKIFSMISQIKIFLVFFEENKNDFFLILKYTLEKLTKNQKIYISLYFTLLYCINSQLNLLIANYN